MRNFRLRLYGFRGFLKLLQFSLSLKSLLSCGLLIPHHGLLDIPVDELACLIDGTKEILGGRMLLQGDLFVPFPSLVRFGPITSDSAPVE